MKTLTVRCGKAKLILDIEKLKSTSTKSLYIRTGKLHGTKFLSQRGNGSEGAGDIIKIEETTSVDVKENLFDRIRIYGGKANAILSDI